MSSPRLNITKASAGSGKTFKLAYNFIRLLLGYRRPDTDKWILYPPEAPSAHRHILAITFTNKATDEMKRRIISQLAILAEMEVMGSASSKYRPMLYADFGLSTPADRLRLRDNARHALRELLFGYSEFNVSTIDAFFQSVLRSFAFEADLSGNYELSLDTDTMIDNGIADTVSQAMTNPRSHRLKEWIKQFMSAGLRAGTPYNIFDRDGSVRSSLRRFMKSLTREDYDRCSHLIDSFLDPEADNVGTLMKNLQKRHDAIAQEMESLGETILGDPDSAAFMDRFLTFIGVATDPDNKTYSTYLKQMDSVESLIKKSSKARPGAALLTETEMFLTLCSHLKAIEALQGRLYYLGLFDAITRSINRLKHENNTIMLSDTNTMLRRIIGDNPSPFIFERTGVRLRHFLIDEFQDTSQMQWEIIKPLLVESLSKDFDNLIIGDVKQCIYRFRNSDPSLLASSLQADPDLRRHIDLHTEGINRRSARHIVEFNYHLFPILGTLTGNKNVYPIETEEVLDSAPAGYVDIECAPVGRYPETAMERTFDHIRRQLDPDRGGYRPCDIAVLCRTNDEAAEITNFLLTKFAATPELAHVSIMSDESLCIGSSQAVKRVIARLKMRDVPPVATSAAEKEAFFISPARFEWLLSEFEQRCVENADAETDPFATIAELAAKYNGPEFDLPADPADEGARSLPLRVEQIINSLPDTIREADSVYLYALMDAVIEFCSSTTPTLHSFLQWWEITGKKRTITSSPSTDAITVMTIHKSKGLEYDCVHVPFVEGKLGKETNLRWYSCTDASGANLLEEMGIEGPLPDFLPLASSADLQFTPFGPQYLRLLFESRLDDLNVLYVAFTRPVRELIVTIAPRSKTDLDKIIKKPTVPSPDDTDVYIETLMVHALECTRDCTPESYGAWSYTSGEPTTRIIKPEDTDSPSPSAASMPGYLPAAQRPIRVVARVSQEE